MFDLTNENNIELMSRYPDNYFDLAIVDPPYGINASKPSKKTHKAKQKNGSILNVKQKEYTPKDWDNKPPSNEYFEELFRVSKNQIIWGCNYYDFPLVGGRIVWDKMNGETDQFGCEIAYNSKGNRTDIVRFLWSGMIQGVTPSKCVKIAGKQQGNKKLNEKRFHPTQKPVKLYEWLLLNHAQEGDKILDTGFGSLSLGLAVHNLSDRMNLELTACELDKEIYDIGINRLNEHTKQKIMMF